MDELLSPETGKQRSQRIEIDYFRKRTGLTRWRWLAIGVALASSLAYAAYALSPERRRGQLSTGPLTMAHAAFEQDCERCHTPFTPMDHQASLVDLDWAGVRSANSLQRMEASCQQCHHVGGHHRDVMNAEGVRSDQNCASCHNDHLGRQHDLTAMVAERCVRCHGSLDPVCVDSSSLRTVGLDFTAESHGDFPSLNHGDSGRLNFDHAQHLRPGQVDPGMRGARLLSMLDPADRERYRRDGQGDDAAIQLDCSSCHRLAGNPDPNRRLAADDDLGRYLQPVSYRQHCAACHPMNPGLASATTTPLPHAVSWQRIDLLLAATFRGSVASGAARRVNDDTQRVPQPGEGAGRSKGDYQTEPFASRESLEAARHRVRQDCLKCHRPADIDDATIAAAARGETEPMVPPRWLTKGLYDHAAHRQIDCRYCHAAAYPADAEQGASPPHDSERVMISGIESCVGCHRDPESATPASLLSEPAQTLIAGQTTWASDRCVLCHRYHGARVQPSEGPSPEVANDRTGITP